MEPFISRARLHCGKGSFVDRVLIRPLLDVQALSTQTFVLGRSVDYPQIHTPDYKVSKCGLNPNRQYLYGCPAVSGNIGDPPSMAFEGLDAAAL
mgnify:CR=1 FL=1